MWKSSPDLCLVGLAEVISLPGWNVEAFFEFRLRSLTAPFDKPLLQDDLRRDARLVGASFLKAGPAGTIFPLTEDQAGGPGTATPRTNPDREFQPHARE